MQRKKAIFIVSGILLVAIVAFLIVLTADQPASGNLLGYSGPSVSGEGSLAYMRVEGIKQGVIDGGVTDAGREGSHIIYSIDHSIDTPVDMNTGGPSGKPRHQPFVITTQLSSATPKLNQMGTTAEVGTVIITYWRENEQGQDEAYYEVKLENTMLSKIRQYKPLILSTDNDNYGDMVDVSFTYRRITWRDLASGIEYFDDWY